MSLYFRGVPGLDVKAAPGFGRVWRRMLPLLALCLLLACPEPLGAQNSGLFKSRLANAFADAPDLIFDVLKAHSAEVLSIAQSASGQEAKAALPGSAQDKGQAAGGGQAQNSSAAYSSLSESEFRKLLRKTLQDNPDILLDVLRAHPQEVLDIAREGNQERRKEALRKQWEEDVKKPKRFATGDRPLRGAPNAPVLVAAYSDFGCPHCERASKVIEEYMLSNPTKVRFIFKHRPLASHKYSRLAAQYFIAASMQSDLKAWALYKGFYSGQNELMSKGEEFILPLAEKVGLDLEKLKADAHGEKAINILEEDLREAKEFGFDGAPYILINDLVLPGAPSREILDFGVQQAMRLK